MSLLGGFSGQKGDSRFQQIAQSIHNNFALNIAPPPENVVSVINAMEPRDVMAFNNARSIEGMQELFKAKSIRARVDPSTETLTLSLADADEIDRELKAEHSAVKVLHVGERRATQHIIKPLENAEPITTGITAQAQHIEPPGNVPPALEHLEGVEWLCSTLLDLFVKHGQLTTGDKDVLKQINPTDSSLEARVTALERWQAEVQRRARAIHVPKVTQHLTLPGAQASVASEDALAKRFDSVLHWVGKLIKAVESKGVKYHNKPMWLPH